MEIHGSTGEQENNPSWNYLKRSLTIAIQHSRWLVRGSVYSQACTIAICQVVFSYLRSGTSGFSFRLPSFSNTASIVPSGFDMTQTGR